MKQFIRIDEISNILKQVSADKQIVTSDDSALIFYDIDYIKDRLSALSSAFPADTLHTSAVKANPLYWVMNKINEWGYGFEAASLGEVRLAESAGAEPSWIVFDSPAKTINELTYALKKGLYLNTDSFEEIDRIAEITMGEPSASLVGVRVNPQVGSGSIKASSVADVVSKFGIPLDFERLKLMEYYKKYSWIRGIHVHIGSQGCPIPLLVKGIKKVFAFAEEVNAEVYRHDGRQQIINFDIGGGLPVSYYHDEMPFSATDYAGTLKQELPLLFSGKFRLITEFGRYIHANTGWVASKIEYVKNESEYNILIIHVGADLFLRKCYHPNDWHHHISILDKNGNPKSDKKLVKYMIAGPLCFAGDVIEHSVELPEAEPGDYLILHDAGAYTISAWSRYNSRQIPKVIGYSLSSNMYEIIKQRESLDQLVDFWK